MSSLTRRRLFEMTGGLALAAAASPVIGRDVSRADLADDVALLREAYETIHPGLYRYNTKAEMDGRFEMLASQWAESETLPERFLALTHLTAAIRCGHTYPNPYNQTDETVAVILGGRRLVPFEFLWLGGRMVVRRDRSSEQAFKPGDEVIAIEGVASDVLLARLMPLSRADGSADAKRVNNMEMRGDTRFETFDIHLPLVLPSIAETARFSLADGRTMTAGLLTAAERSAVLPASVTDSDGDAPLWTFDLGPDGVARLSMPTWATFNSDWDWAAWLGPMMDGLEGQTKGLVVDLRGNEGGLSAVGDLIASRLTAAEIRTPRATRFTRYRKVPDHLNPHLDTWDRSFRDWGDRAVGPAADGFYRLAPEGAEPDGTVRPEGTRFTGPVQVLCDASNSSATFGFAQTVQDARLATLIGPATAAADAAPTAAISSSDCQLWSGGGPAPHRYSGRTRTAGHDHHARCSHRPRRGVDPRGPRPADGGGNRPHPERLTRRQTMIRRTMLMTLALAALASGAHAQTTPSPTELRLGLAGRWSGALGYRDYQSNELFELPVTTTISTPGDGATVVRQSLFDDGPNKPVWITTVSLDDAAAATSTSATFRRGQAPELETEAIAVTAHADATHWTVVYSQTGEDDDQPADIGVTDTRDGDGLLEVKEVRPVGAGDDAWRFRNQTRLTRVGD